MIGTLLVVLFVGSAIFLARNFSEASLDAYAINAEVVKADGNVPITLSVQEPKNTTYFLYSENVAPIDNEELEKSINEDFDGTIKVTDTNIPNTKKVTISDTTGEIPLVVKFNVKSDGSASQGKLILSDEQDKELASIDVPFGSLYHSSETTLSSETAISEETKAEQNIKKQEKQLLKNDLLKSLTSSQSIANDTWNTAHGFNPESNIVEVDTWIKFYTAYNNPDVTKIVLLTDIFRSSTSTTQDIKVRTTSLEIDGQDHKLHLYNPSSSTGTAYTESLRTGYNSALGVGNYRVFHIHDMEIAQRIYVSEAEGAYDTASFVGGNYDVFENTNHVNNISQWSFRFGNIKTPAVPSGTGSGQIGIQRLLRAPRCEVSMYGEVTLNTSSENFYLGSLIIEDGTKYTGLNYNKNYSVVWFRNRDGDSSTTGYSREFTIGKNATVYLKNSTTGVNYPAAYQNIDIMTVGEDSTYSANMNGTAMTFHRQGMQVVVKDGASMNLLSRGSNAVITYVQHDTGLTVEPGGSIFVAGITNTGGDTDTSGETRLGLVDFNGHQYAADTATRPTADTTGGGTRELILNQPKEFDFNNKNATKTGVAARAIEIPNNTGSIFKIINSDVELWKNATSSNYSSDYSFEEVENFEVKGRAVANILSTDTVLQSTYLPNNFRRISGFNVPPQILWPDIVTDTDKGYRVRVKVADVPDHFDETTGEIITIPVYARAGQAKVIFTNSRGEVSGEIPTTGETTAGDGKNGYASGANENNKLNLATTIEAHVSRGSRVSDSVYAVHDVTPPEPKDVQSVGVNEQGTIETKANTVTNATKQLKGDGVEAGADVYLGTSNDFSLATKITTVGADGTWIYDLPNYLNVGETIYLFLKDSSTAKEDIEQEAAEKGTTFTLPPTLKAEGNNNPSPSAINYHDATFPPAKKYTVSDVLPVSAITKTVSAKTSDGNDVPLTGVTMGDYLTYTIKVKNNKLSPVNNTWRSVVIEDTLPFGLSLATSLVSNLQLGGVNLPTSDYTYDETTRKLVVQLGDLIQGEEKTLTVRAKVTIDAVGEILSNMATTKGYSPQQKLADGETTLPAGAPSADLEDYLVLSSSDTADLEAPVIGTLLLTAPDVIDFGTEEVKATKTSVGNPGYYKLVDESQPYSSSNRTPAKFIIQDARTTRNQWQLKVKLEQQMQMNDGGTIYQLIDAIKFKPPGAAPAIDLGTSDQVIATGLNTSKSQLYDLNAEWGSDEGFRVEVPAGDVKKIGDYSGIMTWTLEEAP